MKTISIFAVAFPLDGFKDFNLIGTDVLYLAQRFGAKLRSFQYRFGVCDGHVLREHPAFLEISFGNLSTGAGRRRDGNAKTQFSFPDEVG